MSNAVKIVDEIQIERSHIQQQTTRTTQPWRDDTAGGQIENDNKAKQTLET